MAVSNYIVRQISRTILYTAINAGTIKGISNTGATVVVTRADIYKENMPESSDDFFIKEWLIGVNDVPADNDTSGGTGFYQLNIYTKKGVGTNLSDTVAYTIANAFGEGVSYTMDSTKVTIDQSNVEQSFEDNNYWVTPIRIEYRKFQIT